MKNAKYFLRKQGKGDPVIVFELFDSRFKGRRFMYSTGHHCPAGQWDKRKQRTRNQAINKHLDFIQNTVKEFIDARFDRLTLSREDLKEWIISHLKDDIQDRHAREIAKTGEQDFFKTWKEIIETTKRPDGQPLRYNTAKQKRYTKTLLQTYAAEMNTQLTFDSFSIRFYHMLDKWMIDRGLNGNSRGQHFKEIKAVLAQAIERDIPVNMDFKKRSWRVIKTTPDAVFLNSVEIRKILLQKLPDNLSRHRDIFIMACFVGARHSDWHQIREENIIKDGNKEILRYRQTKTGDVVHVPLHPVVRMILSKYKTPPDVISGQKFNKAIKEIARRCKLGTCSLNGEVIEKAEAISTHTARRSFATNAYLSRSMDVRQIMNCTGHKTEAAFLAYLKLDGRDLATLAAESKFFTDGFSLLKIAQ
jgi:integrase